MTTSFMDLPEDVLSHIALNLEAPDVLHFLSANRKLHESLGNSDTFWRLLLDRDCDEEPPSSTRGGTKAPGTNRNSACLRQEYLLLAHRYHLPAVRWHALQRSFGSGISAREGHIACVLDTQTEERICVSGGFADDPTVYVLHVPKNDASATWIWSRLNPEGPSHFVYGSSLTALDDKRAIRLGGFQSGGYSGEVNDVTLLTVAEEIREGSDKPTLVARWEVKTTRNTHFCSPRAYHSATLLGGRYLLVVGGMASRGSIVDEAILDTKTWTWLDPAIITSASSLSADNNKPSGRHGHSMILDNKRNRLVLFGGGSGSDLLRSGHDNAEVWQLSMGDCWDQDLEESFPWSWSMIHGEKVESNDNDDSAMEEQSQEGEAHRVLSATEQLIIGRCHDGVKISPDTALFVFGSGRPSTNGTIAYNLRDDTFLRPKIEGPLPKPRFTFVSAFLKSQGYLFVHGGYSSQQGDAIADMNLLDVSPLIKDREFRGLPVNNQVRCHGPITEDDLQRRQQSDEEFLHQIFETLGNADEEARPAMAAEMLGQLIANGLYGGRAFMLMNMIARGHAVLRFGDNEENDDSEGIDDVEDDDDSSYHDTQGATLSDSS